MTTKRILCSACGFANESSARFCSGCARPVVRSDSSLSRRPLPAATNVPPRLAERILASRGAIKGERKLVTVMFADVLGSFEIIAGRDPEHAQAILDSLLRTMIDAVHRYEGTVNQVLGDGIMALFGAPLAHEDHAVRAACAALAIQDAMRAATDSAWERLGIQPKVRIGLNSGVVVITAVHNDLSLDYRAVGATTHLAARMEQIALPGTIRLTRDTLRLAEGFLDTEPLGKITIKGISEPVEIFALQRMTPGGTRFRARLSLGLTPLFGRSEEIEQLTGLLGDVASGHPSEVAFYGEPGVGKSRLCYDVTRIELARGFRAIETAAVSFEPTTPYSAIVRFTRRYFGIADTETAAESGRRVREALGEMQKKPADCLSVLLGLLDIPDEDKLWQSLDPAQRKRRVTECIRALISALCESRPLILIWEDLHWFDAESLDFVRGLLREPPGRSLLTLVTSRAEPSGWERLPIYRRNLLPLPPPLADGMLRNLMGEATQLAGLRTLLIERTNGNPFFIEETVRSLTESGVLFGSSGNLELRDTQPSIDIPPTAEALIAARIDGLSPDVKALVQTAAVVGNEMSVDVLRRVGELEEAEVLDRLAAAVDAGLLYVFQSFPSPLCGFRHALTHDVAYRGILNEQRRLLHQRIVEVLEDVHKERLAEHVERLAEHSFRAELWEKSVRYHILAAARAATRFANHEAIALLNRGLQIVEHLAPGKLRAESEIDLRLAGLAALLPLGEQERILSTLMEAEAIARTIDDPRRLAAIHSQIATALWMLGQHERARDSATQALRIAEEQKQFGLRLSACFSLAMAHHALANHDLCVKYAGDLDSALTGDLERKRFGWAGYPSVLCRTWMASSLMLTGQFEQAKTHLDRGCRLADAMDHPFSRTLIRLHLGVYNLMRGEHAEALSGLQQVWQIARESEVRTMYGPVAGWLGVTLAELGRFDEAIATIEEVNQTEVIRLCGHYSRFYMLNGLAIAYTRTGRHAEALKIAREAVDRTLECKENVHHGIALLRHAEVLSAIGADSHIEAESVYRQALAHAAAHQMRPLAAECHEGLGRLSALRRKVVPAQAALRTAARLYREMGLEAQSGSAQAAAEKISAGA